MSELMGGSSALTGRPDYENAAFMMLIGSNPVVSHGHTIGLPNPRGAIRDLTKHADVWVVDPRYTETARLATHHLAPGPAPTTRCSPIWCVSAARRGESFRPGR